MAFPQTHSLDTANGRRNIRRQRLPCSQDLRSEDKELASRSRIAGAKARGVRLATRIEYSSERNTDARCCANLRKIVRIRTPSEYASTRRQGSSTTRKRPAHKADAAPCAAAMSEIWGLRSFE